MSWVELKPKEDSMTKKAISRYVLIGLSLFGLCMASGCAPKDTVSARLPELQDSINAAKEAGAEVYAPTPLKSAEAKLEKAKIAVTAQDMDSGNALVDEAMLDADYARALAPTKKAKNEGTKLRAAIQAVREEINQLLGAN